MAPVRVVMIILRSAYLVIAYDIGDATPSVVLSLTKHNVILLSIDMIPFVNIGVTSGIFRIVLVVERKEKNHSLLLVGFV